MQPTPAQRFWTRTKRLTGVLLGAWLLLNLAAPWFARELNHWQAFGFPLGYWIAAQGGLLAYLLMIVIYVVWMDRLEARFLNESDSTACGDAGAAGAVSSDAEPR